MRGTRQLVMVLTAVATAILLASGLAVAATLTGTDGSDQIKGTAGVDEIQGKGGDDTLEGMAGNDRVVGGADNDRLYGGDAAGTALAGEDVVIGEHGNDEIHGGPAADELRGSAGNDTVFSGEVPFARDVVDCGDGTDEAWADPLDSVANNCEKRFVGYQGTGGIDTIDGSAGDDNMWGHGGDDTIDGAGGVDEIDGGEDADTLDGGDGADVLSGSAGNDLIRAGILEEAAEDKVRGGDGDDAIYSANLPASKDVIDCGGGTDEVTVDSLDQVSDNCENVETFDPDAPPEGEPPASEVEETVELEAVPEDEAAELRDWARSEGLDVPEPDDTTVEGQNTLRGPCGSTSLFMRDIGSRFAGITIAASSTRGPIAAYAYRITIFNNTWSRARIGSGTDNNSYFYANINQMVPRRGWYTATLQQLYVYHYSGRVCVGLRPWDSAYIT